MAACPLSLLRSWLHRSDVAATTWVTERCRAVVGGDESTLALAWGLAPRRCGKADLVLTPEDLAEAEACRRAWDPRGLSVDQAARLLLVLAAKPWGRERFAAALHESWRCGDVAERVVLARALPLLPWPEDQVWLAAEGVRSNLLPVVAATALANPYPAEQLDDGAWRQLVLKVLFTGLDLHAIVGVDARAHAELAEVLVDYARERRVAQRPVPIALWRCVAPFADTPRARDELTIAQAGPDAEAINQAIALFSANPEPLNP